MERIHIVIAMGLLLMVGCATDPAAKLAQHQIRTVAVEQRVEAPPMRAGEKQNYGLQAALTSSIVDSIYSGKIKRMAAVMQEKEIHVPAMVRTNFLQAARELGYELAEGNADATFVVQLEQYGFDERAPFSSIMVPFAILNAELVKADGTVIWEGKSDGPKGNDPAVIGVKEWDEYESDPERLRQDWNVVVRNAVANLLRAAKPKA